MEMNPIYALIKMLSLELHQIGKKTLFTYSTITNSFKDHLRRLSKLKFRYAEFCKRHLLIELM